MKNKIWYILKKEVRETFRDKKSLSMMLIIPFMIPIIIIGMSALFESQIETDINEYNKIGFAYELTDAEKGIIENLKIDAVVDTLENLEEKYANKEIDIYLTRDENTIYLNGYSNTNTLKARSLVESYVTVYKEYLQREFLVYNKINADDVLGVLKLESKISDKENFYSNYVTVYGFLFIIMAITVSATYPSTDTTAGEKERGTLETLLTFPIKSKDIIIGKFLSVSLSTFLTGIFGLILMLISLKLSGGMFKIYEGVKLIPPVLNIIIMLLIIILLSLLISGLCISIASKSKSFKEAQSALTPLNFISVFPGLIAFMINVESSRILSLIPFLNYTIIIQDLTNGVVDWINIILMFISTILIIVVVLYLIIKQYKSEKVLFSN